MNSVEARWEILRLSRMKKETPMFFRSRGYGKDLRDLTDPRTKFEEPWLGDLFQL